MAEMAVLGKAIVNPLLVVALGQSVLIAGHETQVAQESLCVVDQTQIVVDGGVGRGQRSLEVAETFQLKGLQLALGLIAVSLVHIAERHVVALETTGVVGAHLQVIAAQQGVVESPSGLGKGSAVGCQQAFGKRSALVLVKAFSPKAHREGLLRSGTVGELKSVVSHHPLSLSRLMRIILTSNGFRQGHLAREDIMLVQVLLRGMTG